MSELERPDEEACAALLGAYREHTAPPAGTSQRVWSGLEQAGAAGALGGGAATAAHGKLWLVLGGVVALGGGGWLAFGDTGATPSRASRPAAAEAVVETVAEPPAVEPVEVATAEARRPADSHPMETAQAAPTKAPERGLGGPATSPRRSHRAQQASGPSSLAQELALLSEAKAARDDGHPQRALALLVQHRRRHRRGAMSEEREAARVEVLCELGRIDQAKRGAQAFARRFPGSSLLARLQAACAGAP